MSKTYNAGYFEGYQSAMRDIAERLDEGGETAVREWVGNNLRPEAAPAEFIRRGRHGRFSTADEAAEEFARHADEGHAVDLPDNIQA